MELLLPAAAETETVFQQFKSQIRSVMGQMTLTASDHPNILQMFIFANIVSLQ